MIALYDSYLSLARQMVYPVSEIRKVTNKNLKICIPSADFLMPLAILKMLCFAFSWEMVP